MKKKKCVFYVACNFSDIYIFICRAIECRVILAKCQSFTFKMTTIQKCPENATFKMMFLVFLGVAYLILGAFVFSAAELENENREKKELLLIENDLK